jgi:biotin carboxyl carrier protein
MKTEQLLTAPFTGTVKGLAVEVGTEVAKGTAICGVVAETRVLADADE